MKTIATAVIGLVLCLGGLGGALALSPDFRAKMTIGRPEVVRIGDTTTLAPEAYGASPLTLFVFARSNCAACIKAKPMLRRAVSAFTNRGQVLVVVPTRAAMEAEVSFAREIGLGADRIRTPEQLGGAAATIAPTFLIVDCRGKILFIAEGISTSLDAIESGILKALDSPPSCGR